MQYIDFKDEELIRELFKNITTIDETVVGFNDIKIRNTLDSFKSDILFTNDVHESTKTLTDTIFTFFKTHKYELGLDITKNVMVTVVYTKWMQPSYTLQFIV